MLDRHPDIFVSQLKELHYFDRDRSYPSPNKLSVSDPLDRIFSRDPVVAHLRRKVIRQMGASIQRRRFGRALWLAKFLYGRFDDQWYASLFANRPERVCGEVTPAYAILTEATWLT